MDETDDEVATIVPSDVLMSPKPEILETAIRHLEVATDQFYLAMQRFHHWRVLAYDSRLVERLGKGYATGGFLSVRGAIFEALLISLTRMFDQGVRGRHPLSLRNICRVMCRPEIREFIVRQQSADRPDRTSTQRDFEALVRACSVRSTNRAYGTRWRDYTSTVIRRSLIVISNPPLPRFLVLCIVTLTSYLARQQSL
jgi:hypothetical protein